MGGAYVKMEKPCGLGVEGARKKGQGGIEAVW